MSRLNDKPPVTPEELVKEWDAAKAAWRKADVESWDQTANLKRLKDAGDVLADCVERLQCEIEQIHADAAGEDI